MIFSSSARIRLEYEQRVLRLKEEIRRRDDEYVAGIEVRRTAKSPEEPQITSSPSTQSKWSLALNIVPITNKLKTRLGASGPLLNCLSSTDADDSVFAS